MQGLFEIRSDPKKSFDIFPFLDILVSTMLAFALHYSLGEIQILPIDFEFSEVSGNVVALGSRLFVGAFGGKEIIMGPGHNHLNRFCMLSGSHHMLESIHRYISSIYKEENY